MKKTTFHFLLTLITAALSIGVVAGTSHAQADSTHARYHRGGGMMAMPSERMMEKHLHMMKTGLNLTDAQTEQVKGIMQQRHDKMKADMDAVKNAPKGSDAKKDAMKQLAEDRKNMMSIEEFKSVLTADQYKKLKAMRISMIDKREKRLQTEKKELEK